MYVFIRALSDFPRELITDSRASAIRSVSRTRLLNLKTRGDGCEINRVGTYNILWRVHCIVRRVRIPKYRHRHNNDNNNNSDNDIRASECYPWYIRVRASNHHRTIITVSASYFIQTK